VSIYHASFILAFHLREDPAELIMGRLTAAKEDGVSIEIDGKKVALGIPGAKAPTTAGVPDPKAFSLTPLARPGTADEAAAGMLLYVCFTFARRLEVTDTWTLGVPAWHLHSLHT